MHLCSIGGSLLPKREFIVGAVSYADALAAAGFRYGRQPFQLGRLRARQSGNGGCAVGNRDVDRWNDWVPRNTANGIPVEYGGLGTPAIPLPAGLPFLLNGLAAMAAISRRNRG